MVTPVKTPRSTSINASWATSTMSRSMYDACEEYDAQRMKADLLLRVFWTESTEELDKIIEEIMSITQTTFPTISNRFKELSQRTLTDKSRSAKHAYLLFGLYLTPSYAQTLISPTPKVDPTKFAIFYKEKLPTLCNNLLTGVYASLAEFVELARSDYILL